MTRGKRACRDRRALIDWGLLSCLVCFVCQPGLAHGAEPAAGQPPNVVFILADDLGWSDLVCYGADLHETPNLDRLAGHGVRFTQAYAMSVCSPTRSAIMTGKHAARLHMTIWREGSVERLARAAKAKTKLLPPPTVSDLPLEETTIADALRAAGYVTLHVGKWHLGDAAHYPETQGFDVNIGGTHWGAPNTFFHPFSGGDAFREYRYVPGLGIGKPGDYLTDRLTDEALKLLDSVGPRPFYLNLCFHNPHTPIEGKPELVEHFRRQLAPGARHQNAQYAAMVRTLDDNVGRVLRYLDERQLADRTLVVFTSDNGGYVNEFGGQRVTDNTPLRSGKGSLYEGGIRVPLIVRWPGVTPSGATCDEPVLCTDWFRTLTEAARVRPASDGDAGCDGLSLVPLLRDPQTRLDREALFFHYPHYYRTTTPVSAVRQGDWKLLEYYEDQRRELYHLREDPSEARDLAAEQPEKAAELRRLLDAWRNEVGAQLPEPRPLGE